MKNIVHSIIILSIGVFSLGGPVASYAQDIHFAHFYASPLTLNAAYAGNNGCDLRAGLNYRLQHTSVPVPYRTVSAYADARLPISIIPKGSIGAGLHLVNDRSGDGGLSTNKLVVSLAYHYPLIPSKLSMSGGLGIGYISRKLDVAELIFDDQYDGEYFDPNITTGEPISGEGLHYFDLTVGAMATYQIDADKIIFGGTHLMHVNTPTDAFSSSDHQLGLRPIIHGGAYLSLTSQLVLEPSILYMRQKKAQEFMMGANAAYQPNLTQDFKLNGGLWFRGTGDLIPVVGATYKSARLLMSYDLNLAKVSTASQAKGGFELSLQYTWCFPAKDPGPIIVPCIRY